MGKKRGKRKKMRRRAMLLLGAMVATLVVASAGALAVTTIHCKDQDSWGSSRFCSGTDGEDVIYGTNVVDESGFSEQIDGLHGADVIYGYGGNDYLFGDDSVEPSDDPGTLQDGNDKVYGSSGEDFIGGFGGSDLLSGGPGPDDIYAQELSLNEGEDTVNGGGGRDYIKADDGKKDTINCGKGYDVVYFDEGIDVVSKNCNEQHPVTAAVSAAEASGERGALRRH